MGASGSGVYYNAVDVLSAYGLDVEKDINPTYQSFGDSAESLQDGKIDAAFVVAGAPTTAITSLAATKPVYLVSLDDEHIDKLLADSPYYSKTTISKDTYNMPEDVTTVAVGMPWSSPVTTCPMPMCTTSCMASSRMWTTSPPPTPRALS